MQEGAKALEEPGALRAGEMSYRDLHSIWTLSKDQWSPLSSLTPVRQ